MCWLLVVGDLGDALVVAAVLVVLAGLAAVLLPLSMLGLKNLFPYPQSFHNRAG